MLECYSRKALVVDLSSKRVKTEEISEGICRSLIGGKGFGAHFLMESGANLSPYDPEAPIVLAAGPAVGLDFPAASRIGCFFKSPLTGFFGESYCGGYLGPELKKAGLDAMVVVGKAEKPSYVLVEDGKAEVRSAEHLWGLDCFKAEEVIKEECGKGAQVACIGPAGENLVRFACITHDTGRQLGRCGGGAVMGAKRLKAIAVKGSGEVEASDPDRLRKLRDEIVERVKKTHGALMKYGTPAISVLTNASGALPTKYWTDGSIDWFEDISPDRVAEKYFKKRSCYLCPIGCRHYSRIGGVEVEGPEYETWFALGSLCLAKDVETIVKANEVCDRLGLDTITAGNVVAFTMYLLEKGLISREEVGVEISFDKPEGMLELLPRIAYRKGFGMVLAEGVKRASEIIGRGAEALAVHVKGLEPPGYEPRVLKGMALGYAVSSRGACHLRHMSYRPNLTGQHPFNPDVKVDRSSYMQAEMVAEQESFYALVDSMILCKFYSLPTIGPILWRELADLYTAATGVEATPKELAKAGERITTLARLYSVREGLRKKDDHFTPRVYSEPIGKGPAQGESLDREKFTKMLEDYYRIRGWPDGVPSREKLAELGLEGYL